jgi:acetylornithine deacetylase/succinyl-diaminopimelate desuccinylase-like protein
MYGHLDKQPFGEGWETDPCEPVIKDGRLYGRGSSDDGYALFTAITAIKACQQLGKSHPKVVITIEGSEEGEIFDLVHYLAKYKDYLDNPTLVICLDSVAFTEDTMTITSCLRGCLTFDLNVKVTENNIHSGMGGGICPNAYHILNCLLMRVQDFKTQEVIDELQIKEIPPHRLEEVKYMGEKLEHMTSGLPFLADTKSVAFNQNPNDPIAENIELAKNNFWRSQIAVIGI